MLTKWKHSLVAILLFAMLWPGSGAYSQSNKISGYVFGDYYYIAACHDNSIEKNNGFWFRRIYFTYDHDLNESFSARFRIEMNSPGNFTSNEKLQPFVKDAYLRWNHSRHNIIVGLSVTPTWQLVEKIWGLRFVEKTPLDLQKFGSSRDLGLALKGSFDSQKRVNYHFMLANGGGTSSETNPGKKVLFSLSAKPTPNFIVEGYADFEERPGRRNRYTLQGFAAYQQDDLRFGVQFAHQTRQIFEDREKLNLQIASVFAATRFSPHIWAFARYDRNFDPNPDAGKIAYVPFIATAKTNFVLLGLDLSLSKAVHLSPNVELIVYDKVSGERHDADVIPRITFYYVYQ
ncbi:hypothetical protein GWO43_09370 [candidate division KSB1 bacterium]|nr:hypothetical protein [candidate division KSB1 bacterium]NIR69358.1 hypothetical protein [candidate division KSB1 bacterium]NIS24176.1 hypothetical protein [candidate division KSB1 bacterium]NIT71091.1 hypothetical protein [candidate division KSB1 bacterium]NIU24795.1 hypothetical protein [candidate division KSB1 bacterium]